MAIHLLFVTDIFGLTPSLNELVTVIARKGIPASIVSPYQTLGDTNHDLQSFSFEHDQAAYDQFIKACGHENYIEKCILAITRSIKQIKDSKDTLYIIGFSAGASAIWCALTQAYQYETSSSAFSDVYFTGFYPSQIRHHTKLEPKGNIQLIFPSHEHHFDLDIVIKELVSTSNTECILTSFQHGFLNNKSTNFDSNAYHAFKGLILNSELLSKPDLLHHTLKSAFTA